MNNSYLQHHGVKGMKWGVRRFENKDGSLTAAGKKRYAKQDDISSEEQAKREQRKATAKKVAIGAAVVGGTVLAAYGAYKFNDYIKMESTKVHMKNGEKFGINNPDESFGAALKNVVDDRSTSRAARQYQKDVARRNAKIDRDTERRRAKNQRRVDRINDKQQRDFERRMKPYQKAEERRAKNAAKNAARGQRALESYYGSGNVPGKDVKLLPKKRRKF